MKSRKRIFFAVMLAAAGSLALAVGVPAEGAETLTADLEYEYDYIEALEGRWAHYCAPKFSLKTEGFEALSASLEEYSASKLAYAKASAEQYAEWIREEGSEALDNGMDYFVESEISIRRADSVVFSFNNLESSYSGGAHPNAWYSPVTYSSATGEKLALTDILQDPSSLPELLQDLLLEKYDEDTFLTDDLAGDIRLEMETTGSYIDVVTGEEVPMEPGPSFTLEPESITFWFSPYELTSHAVGAVNVTLYYEDYPDLVKEEYLQAAESWFLPLEDEEEVRLPGSEDVLSVSTVTEDEYGMDWKILTTVNGFTKEEEEWGFDFDHYLMHTGGKNFLITQVTGEDDYSQMRITDLSGAPYITSGSQIPDANIIARHFGTSCPTNPEYCVLNHGIDLLSTYTVGRPFRFTADGVPEPLEPWDTIYDYSTENYEMALTTKRSLEVMVVDEAGEETGKAELPAGTKLHFLRTDGELWVDMTDDDGTIYHLFVEGVWPQQVNGLNADDVFDGMMFAG